MSAKSIARNGICSFGPAANLICRRMVIGTATHSLMYVRSYSVGDEHSSLPDSVSRNASLRIRIFKSPAEIYPNSGWVQPEFRASISEAGVLREVASLGCFGY